MAAAGALGAGRCAMGAGLAAGGSRAGSGVATGASGAGGSGSEASGGRGAGSRSWGRGGEGGPGSIPGGSGLGSAASGPIRAERQELSAAPAMPTSSASPRAIHRRDPRAALGTEEREPVMRVRSPCSPSGVSGSRSVLSVFGSASLEVEPVSSSVSALPTSGAWAGTSGARRDGKATFTHSSRLGPDTRRSSSRQRRSTSAAPGRASGSNSSIPSSSARSWSRSSPSQLSSSRRSMAAPIWASWAAWTSPAQPNRLRLSSSKSTAPRE